MAEDDRRRAQKEFMTRGAERVLRWSFLVPLTLLALTILYVAITR